MSAVLMCIGSIYAAVDKKITVRELPQAAQNFLNTHFAGIDVAYAEMDDDVAKRDYEVMLRDGTKIEFDRNGEWKEIDCFRRSVPKAVIPERIASYVATNYPDEKIVEIERGTRKTEVKLTNGFELKFNDLYELVKIDR